VTVAELVNGLSIRVAGDAGAGEVRVCDITEDSRTALPGSLFVARRGEASDGREYVEQAIEGGAVAVLTEDDALTVRPGTALLVTDDVARAGALLAERFYGEPSRKLTLIGVTGTNGKTTTAYMVHRILNGAGLRCGLVGTVVVDDGVEVAPASLTTPPAFELSRTLGVMVEAGCEAAVVEVSSHALHQGRVDGLAFDAAVFTNLTGDHLDYHGSVEAYASAKARLFEMLPADGTAVVNADDAASERMLRDCGARVVRCSTMGDERADCRASILSMSLRETRARFSGAWGDVEATLRVVGAHNTANALQAVAVCHAIDRTTDELLAGITRAAPPPGRLEPVHVPGDPIAVLVDYAHTDDALSNVLRAVGPLVPRRGEPGGGRLWVVFGCGGDRDQTKRPRMGEVVSRLADRIVVTSDNPRTERPGAIIDQILTGMPHDRRDELIVEPDRGRAIARAICDAETGDLVLIAGKGHETDQISADASGRLVYRHFDDREAARGALESRRGAAAGVGGGPA
jgi:UDP-N-acetylmuramoyl-L-alanyl-D-glutamate--2,6-diaminopimelate ligase